MAEELDAETLARIEEIARDHGPQTGWLDQIDRDRAVLLAVTAVREERARWQEKYGHLEQDIASLDFNLRQEIDKWRTSAESAEREVERLRAGGCARDQNTTQFCAEAVALERELAEAREANVAVARQRDREWYEALGYEWSGNLPTRRGIAERLRKIEAISRDVVRWYGQPSLCDDGSGPATEGDHLMIELDAALADKGGK